MLSLAVYTSFCLPTLGVSCVHESCLAALLVGWELALILAALMSSLITCGVTTVCLYRNRVIGGGN